MLVCLLLGVLIGYSAKTVTVLIEENQNNKTYQKYPRRTIDVKLEMNQQEMLFDKLHSFAEHERFAIRIAPTTPSGADYLVQMWRNDINIIAVNSFHPKEFSIYVFDTDSAVSIPEWAVSSIKNKLVTYLKEIPNVTISEEK